METSERALLFGALFFVLIICVAIIRFFQRRASQTKLDFLTASRNLGPWESALSIAASWVWAPSLFVSAQKAYQDGLLGLFWFVVPNILCLMLFSLFAERIRKQRPQGFTLSEFILSKTSTRVQTEYWVTLTGLSVCAFAVQLLAGAQLLARLTELSFFACTVLLALVPLSYSLFSGLKGSIATDVFKMFLLYSLGFTLVPWALSNAGGLETLSKGLGGQVGSTDFFGPENLKIFLTFGLPTTIGLISGPFGDQSFWQRAFSIREGAVKSSFLRAAFFFALVPLLMSVLGFIATGSAMKVGEAQTVNLESIRQFLPHQVVWLFVLMIIVALVSTLDTKLTSIASLGGHDFVNRLLRTETASYERVVWFSRISMVSLAIVAIAIANIPGLKILHLFLFYGTLRSSTLLPTILLLSGVRVSERGIFWGILAALFFGLPMFAYGNLVQDTLWIVCGSVLTVGLSGIFAVLISPSVARQPSTR